MQKKKKKDLNIETFRSFLETRFGSGFKSGRFNDFWHEKRYLNF